MQRILLAILWAVGGLLLVGNIAVYYEQRHYFITTIEAWHKQDIEVREKAVLYDEIRAAEIEKAKYDSMPEREKVLQAIRDCAPRYQPAPIAPPLRSTTSIRK